MTLLISDFLLATWLFSITYDWFHILINTCMLWFLLCVLLRMTVPRAIMLSFSAHFFSFVVYTTIALSIFVHRITAEYGPSEVSETSGFSDIFCACLQLAVVYALLQSIFLLLMHIRSEYQMSVLIAVAWLSNIISGLLSYGCIVFFLTPML